MSVALLVMASDPVLVVLTAVVFFEWGTEWAFSSETE